MEDETKQQVTKKFISGIILIVISFILGKLILIPLLLFPNNSTWWLSMIIVYICSWIILIVGVFLAGIEGFRLVTHRYREYRRNTMATVKEKSKKMASKALETLRKRKSL